jgi:hypothetical protein
MTAWAEASVAIIRNNEDYERTTIRRNRPLSSVPCLAQCWAMGCFETHSLSSRLTTINSHRPVPYLMVSTDARSLLAPTYLGVNNPQVRP